MPFVLTVQPAIFGILVGSLGFIDILIKKHFVSKTIYISLAVFVALGVLSQLLVTTRSSHFGLDASIDDQLEASKAKNLISPAAMRGLHGWNEQDGQNNYAQRIDRGFWRVSRVNALTGKANIEILSDITYYLKPDTYIQSFVVRHDGKEVGFNIDFLTAQGRNPVKAKWLNLGNKMWMAYASYKLMPQDKWIRVMDLVNFKGDWSYIDIGYPQLKLGGMPSRYTDDYQRPSLESRIFGWVGNGLLSLLIFQGCMVVFQYLRRETFALGLFGGLVFQLAIAMYQFGVLGASRVSGTLPEGNPNFLGHTMVMLTALMGIFVSANIAWISYLMLAITIILSGTRIALVGFLWLAAISLIKNRKGIVIFLLLFIAGVLLLSTNSAFARLLDLKVIFDESRVQIWSTAWKAFLTSPIYGIGGGGFPEFYLLNSPIPAIEPAAGHAHNIFLQLLAESGLLGLAAFSILWGTVVWEMWQLRALGVLGLIGMALFINMVDYTWFYAGVNYCLWIGIAWAIKTSSKVQADRMTG